MDDRSQHTAHVRHDPPRRLFWLVNPVMKTLLRSPIGSGPLGGVLALLTFTGRKTGKPYTTPVGYHRFAEEGDRVVYLFTGAPWWKNLRHGAPVTMRIKGRDIAGRAFARQDEAEQLRRVRELLGRYGLKNARRLGLTIDPGHEPTDDELRAALRGHAFIRVELDQSIS